MLLPRRSGNRARLQLLELETRLVPALAGLSGPIAAGQAAPPPAVTQTAPPVGANIDAVTDWALSNMFVDVMKQARQFTSVARDTPDNYVPAATDANGWATEDFEAIVLTGALGVAKVDNGTYHLSFSGQASVSTPASPATIGNVVYNPTTNTTTADITVNADNNSSLWYLILKFQNTSGGVKNVKLIRPGYDPNTTQTFTNEFLKQIAPFSTLRFMDFAHTNNNAVVNWADRTHVADATQATDKGSAWEYAIQLANQTHKDLWVNVPEGATDDYVRQFATLLKNNLDPSRHVYVEYSNEVWNGIFSQTASNNAAAVAEVQAGMASGRPSNLQLSGETGQNADGTWQSAWLWGDRRIARRIEEISDDVRSVWGDAAIGSTVRPVLASQSANPDLLKAQLDFLERTYGPPRQYLYAVAGAPYFSLQGDTANPNMTTDQVLAGLSAGLDQVEAEFAPYARLAATYGLQDLAYEGGPDTFGGTNIAAKKAASLDPRMAGLIQRYLTDWFANGGGLFNWFIAGPTNYDTPYGTWGLTNDLTQLDSPKQQGIAAVENALMSAPNLGAPVNATPTDPPVTTVPPPADNSSATPKVSTGFSYAAGMSSTGLNLSGAAGVRSGRLRLTSGSKQSASAFFGTPVGVGAFRTQFDFQLSGSGDGAFAFTLQGKQGQRVGVQFDGYNATGLVVNGAVVSARSLTGQGVDLRSRHTFRAAIAYDGATLTVTLTDLATGKTAVQKYAVNVAAVLGDTASVGFTAGCGAAPLTQDVLSWTFRT